MDVEGSIYNLVRILYCIHETNNKWILQRSLESPVMASVHQITWSQALKRAYGNRTLLQCQDFHTVHSFKHVSKTAPFLATLSPCYTLPGLCLAVPLWDGICLLSSTWTGSTLHVFTSWWALSAPLRYQPGLCLVVLLWAGLYRLPSTWTGYALHVNASCWALQTLLR